MENKGCLETMVSLIVIVAIFIFSLSTSFNDTEYVVTVTEKERVVDGGSSRYLVFAEDEQGNVVVFKNTDNILRYKYNSSDMQGELKEGETYVFTVVGYRVPFLSMYQNIIKSEAVEIDSCT